MKRVLGQYELEYEWTNKVSAINPIMQQLDVSMLSVEIFFQMSSFSRWWEPSYMKSTDDETWGGGGRVR